MNPFASQPLRSVDSDGLDWARINKIAGESRHSRQETINTGDRLSALDQQALDDSFFFPFRIYVFPSVWRASPNSAADWLKFRVHGGRYQTIKVAGTDGHDLNTGDTGYPSMPDDDAPLLEPDVTDIVFPNGHGNCYFWVDCSNSAAPVLKAGYAGQSVSGNVGDPNTLGWTSFPVPDSNHIPIGWVDTNFDQANNIAIIRQLVRTDLSQTGASGMNYRGTYAPGTYIMGDVVRKQSGGAQGAWVHVLPSSSNVAPVWPEPASTGGTNTWEMITFGVQSTSTCNGGATTIQLNASQTF